MEQNPSNIYMQYANQHSEIATLFNALRELDVIAQSNQNYLVNDYGYFTQLAYDEIYYIETKGSLTRFICKDPKLPFGIYMNKETINEVYEKLDHARFLKCHRCYIVNIKLISLCTKDGKGGIIHFDTRKKNNEGTISKIPPIYFSEQYKQQLIERKLLK